jgi:hypothetical protein
MPRFGFSGALINLEAPRLGADPGELSSDFGSDPGIVVSRPTQI